MQELKFKLGSGEEMKYIAFWESRPEDIGKVVGKYNKLKVNEKRSETYPKCISKNYMMGGGLEGFQLFETDDPEKLANASLYYMPEVKIKFVPIFESEKVIEIYLKKMKIQ